MDEWFERFAPTPFDDCEDLNQYRVGGFHPVVIGDTFADGRYEVMHKLGSGAWATVWLARDKKQNRYVALKILQAQCSEDSRELRMHQHLQARIPDVTHRSAIISLLDQFHFEGPNGRHLALTFEVAGPSLGSLHYHGQTQKLRPDVARSIARQVAQGVDQLHKAGLGYGDLSTNNIIFRLDDISDWSIENIHERLGVPQPFTPQPADGVELDEHVPKFIYEPLNSQAISADLLRPEVMLIDLGEAFLIDEGRGRGFFMNPSYTAPEMLFIDGVPTVQSDIWSLGTVFFELRAAQQLFCETRGKDRVCNDVISAVGPLPKSWLRKMIAHDHDCESSDGRSPRSQKILQRGQTYVRHIATAFHSVKSIFGRCIGRILQPLSRAAQPGMTLSEKIRNIGRWEKWCYMTVDERMQGLTEFNEKHSFGGKAEEVTREECDTGAPPPDRLSDEEIKDFDNLLTEMLRLKPEDRIRLEEILAHPWLRTNYEKEESSEPWLQPYFSGRTYEVQSGKKSYRFP